jgi:hypothetical protein
MSHEDFRIIFCKSTKDRIRVEMRRLFYDLDNPRDHATPLLPAAIGGGFGFPDGSGRICRRIYECGIVFLTRYLPQTKEQMAEVRSDDMRGEWWW